MTPRRPARAAKKPPASAPKPPSAPTGGADTPGAVPLAGPATAPAGPATPATPAGAPVADLPVGDAPVVTRTGAVPEPPRAAAVPEPPRVPGPEAPRSAAEAAAAAAATVREPFPEATGLPVPPAGVPPHPRRPDPVSGPATTPALSEADRGRLLAGEHHDPHGLLGAHPGPDGVVVRVLRPYARRVAVLTGEGAGGERTELRDDGDGLFSGVLPWTTVPEYRLAVAYSGEPETVTGDPYRFLPALGELDLHLIGEGRHEQLWTALGAHPMTHQGVSGTRFTVWAPNARGVRLAGDFNHWDGTGLPLRSLGGTGVWELFVPGLGEGTLYKFEVIGPDGGHSLRADPMARRTQCPPETASVVTASHYTWGDGDWMARRGERPAHRAPFSVYELHLGSWRPGLGYRELAEVLPEYVRDLGFTHVELMPVAEHPYAPSWGYQVTSYYAPTARLGAPDDFRHLVDALHRAGIGVLVDWVPAHFPKDDWALARFDGTPLYEHPDPRRSEHPDWGTLEFDYGRTEVRNFLVANAVYWCEEFHIDGLRVDAVASMLYLDYSREHGEWVPNEYGGRENFDAVRFLQEMNATVYRRCPGVVTVAEESTAWEGVTRPTDSGGLGFGLKWNMGWMHDSLEYVSKEPVHRRYHHNEMTFSMVYAYSENYVLPISHDEVVHGKGSLVTKMPGDWWQRRATHRAYLGFMWAHPGKQLIFMGQEFAQGAEWAEAHGPEWWLLDETYHSAGDHRGVRDLVRDLNTVYAATPALWERDTDPAGFSWVLGDAAEDNVFAFLRYDGRGNPLLAVSNFSPVVRHDYRLWSPEGVAAWTEVLNTDAARYGGGDVRNPEPVKREPDGVRLTLPPLATVWFRPA
ncbi:1,4-alpha-glucan branching enzyme [Streptomyces sp. LP05-1]|uniref:1,4-alpha-glucan branching enzyme GlgB n=1 Tax=Streptomyces pyxinae TaxID=2970734 RepID=A0ABT2CBL5_9ACTN|nr:1,4-alpha-glucan branching enzyme [Streptomyces sp. LP05-1]MCS0634156.1 1,4-alpha-glucan branching enzyme [Streptomyces sp. LP05-1]